MDGSNRRPVRASSCSGSNARSLANIMGDKTSQIEKAWYNKRSGKRKGYKVVVVK